MRLKKIVGAFLALALTSNAYPFAYSTQTGGNGLSITTVPKGTIYTGIGTIDILGTLAAGTDGQFLQADSTQSGGLKWGSVSGSVFPVSDSVFKVVNASDNTKAFDISLSGTSAARKTTFAFAATANQTITFPNATLGDTVCLLGQTQRLSNKSFYNTGLAFVDNNNLAQLSINMNPANSSSNTTLTASSGSGGGSLMLPAGTHTLVGQDTTDTLTNKTIDDASNTIRATSLATTTTPVAVSGATAPSVGFALVAASPTIGVWSNILQDSGSNNSLDYGNRRAIANDGSTVKIDYSSSSATNFYSAHGLEFQIAQGAGTVVNYVSLNGAPSGNTPIINSVGADASIGVTFMAKGAGGFVATSGTGAIFQGVNAGSGSVNWLLFRNSTTGNPTAIEAFGGDSSIDLNLIAKGNGYVESAQPIAAFAGFRASEATNGPQGTGILVAGTDTVSNTSVTANSRIFLTAQDANCSGNLRVSVKTAGISFKVDSTLNTDTCVFAYEIFEAA